MTLGITEVSDFRQTGAQMPDIACSRCGEPKPAGAFAPSMLERTASPQCRACQTEVRRLNREGKTSRAAPRPAGHVPIAGDLLSGDGRAAWLGEVADAASAGTIAAPVLRAAAAVCDALAWEEVSGSACLPTFRKAIALAGQILERKTRGEIPAGEAVEQIRNAWRPALVGWPESDVRNPERRIALLVDAAHQLATAKMPPARALALAGACKTARGSAGEDEACADLKRIQEGVGRLLRARDRWGRARAERWIAETFGGAA